MCVQIAEHRKTQELLFIAAHMLHSLPEWKWAVCQIVWSVQIPVFSLSVSDLGQADNHESPGLFMCKCLL